MFILVVLFLLGGKVFAETDAIVISEIQITGGTGRTSEDFIELYNSAEKAISLDGWQLKKRAKTGNESSLAELKKENIIPAKGYFLWANNSLVDMDPDVHNSYSIASDNSIALFDADQEIVDAVAWGSGHSNPFIEGESFPLNSSSKFFERKKDGNGFQDTDDNKQDFVINESSSPTAGNCKDDYESEKCLIIIEEENEDADKVCLVDIILNEVLPNPSGDETRNEYIELKNNSDSLIDLGGWKLYDLALKEKYDDGNDFGYVIPDGTSIKIEGYAIIYRDAFKFSLHNTQEEAVFLKDPCGNFISKIDMFKGAKEDYAYSFDGTNWRWSSHLTPKAENKFDSIPQVQIKIDKEIFKNIPASFEAVVSGENKNKAKFSWDFGDDGGSNKQKTTHTYAEEGKYTGSIKVTGVGEDFLKKFEVLVEKFKNPKVRIIAVNPNPVGSDEESESITVQNKSKKQINLKGWSIATGTSSSKLSNHPITKDLFIKAGKILEITREFSKFSLGNKKTKVELRYPDGDVAHDIKYKEEKEIKEGTVYKKKKEGEWGWRESVEVVQDIESVEDAEDVEDVQNEGSDESVEIASDVEIVQGFGFGDEEDALEVVEMLINELDRDIDEIYAKGKVQGAQDIQNVEIVQDRENVQGAQDVQNAKVVFPGSSKNVLKIKIINKSEIRVEGKEYRFTRELPDKPHYVKAFIKNSTADINLGLNKILQKL